MLQKTIDEYYEEFLESVTDSVLNSQWEQEVFFNLYTLALTDANICDNPHPIIYKEEVKNANVRIDGYESISLDKDNTSNITLTLFVNLFTGTELNKLEVINQEDAIREFRKVERFIEYSRSNKEFRQSLDKYSIASPFPIAEFIYEQWENIDAFKIILLTDKRLSMNKNSFKNGSVLEKHTLRDCYDFEQYKNEAMDGSKDSTDIEINFIKDTDASVPVLSINKDENLIYNSYIGVITGKQLATIYDIYQNRLLEQNIRAYLQLRPQVNKDITKTLINNPDMFFAYNNGISCIADEIKIENNSIVNIKGFQIVNGGQTTASIHRAATDKTIAADLSLVSVQMKITQMKSNISAADRFDVVSDIVRFSNNQTKITGSDFSSNNPFHIQIQRLSRSIYAPTVDNNPIRTKWYYERLKGQYKDEISRIKTTKEKNRFANDYPETRAKSPTNRKQLFDKNIVAKLENMWELYPNIVALGNVKSYDYYWQKLEKTIEEIDDINERFNEEYFKDLISKLIIFQDVQFLIPEQDLYQTGLPLQAIAFYSISKLAYDIENDVFGKNKLFNHKIIWQQQKVPEGLKKCFEIVLRTVFKEIINPQAGSANAHEWAKKTAFWDLIQKREVKWPESINNYLINKEEKNTEDNYDENIEESFSIIDTASEIVEKSKSRHVLQDKVNSAGVEFWKDVYKWGLDNKQIQGSEITVFTNYIKRGSADLYRSRLLLETLERFHSKGCELYI